jgi:hypothetical protein
VGELLLLKCAGTVMEMQHGGDAAAKLQDEEAMQAFLARLDGWQLRRQAAVAINLRDRLDARIAPVAAGGGSAGADNDFEADAKAEAEELAATPFGATLLYTIGYMYVAKVEEWRARMDGLLGVGAHAWSSIRSRYHNAEINMGVVSSAGRAASMLQQIPGVGVQPTEGVVHAAEALVKLVVVDIEHTLGTAIEWAMADTGIDDAARVQRLAGLRQLGRVYTEAADAYGGERARLKWRADTFRAQTGGAAASALDGMSALKEIELPTVDGAEIAATATIWADGTEHTAYMIRCREGRADPGARKEWWVQKRFSDFDELRLFLTSLPPLPTGSGADGVKDPFPSKIYLGNSLTEQVVAERQVGLDAWLTAIVAGSRGTSKAVRMFLRDDGSGLPMLLRPLAEDFLPAGTAVTFRGLATAPQHNGRSGEVMRYEPSKGRYQVKLLPVDGAAVRLCLIRDAEMQGHWV